MRNMTFIIISPLLGYRLGNKKYLKINKFKENLKKIQENFTSPDIILVSGIYSNEYRKIKSGFRICENKLPYNSGEVEQIKIGLDCSITDRIVIMKEDCEFNSAKIKLGIKKRKVFSFIGNKETNPGMVIEKGMIQNISYGLDNYFGDIIFLGNELKNVEYFISKEHNINKSLHEVVNHLVNMEPMLVL